MEMWGSEMDICLRVRGVWRCVWIKHGAQCVMISGTMWTQELFADNWASLESVSCFNYDKHNTYNTCLCYGMLQSLSQSTPHNNNICLQMPRLALGLCLERPRGQCPFISMRLGAQVLNQDSWTVPTPTDMTAIILRMLVCSAMPQVRTTDYDSTCDSWWGKVKILYHAWAYWDL